MRDYTTNGLLDSIKRRACIPVNQSTYTVGDILAFADDEMHATVIPMILANKTDHFITYSDVTTTTSTVYDIPTMAIGRGLYNVAQLDSQGHPFSLLPIELHRQIDMDEFHNQWRNGYRRRRGYYVEGDKLNLYPDSESGKTLRLYYERMPNRLCRSQAYTDPTEAAEAAQVTAVDTGTNVITFAAVPASFVVGADICCVKGDPGFSLKVESDEISAADATTITIGDASDVAVGDWIALEGDSPIPQIPVQAHPVLAQAATVKLLEAMGDEAIQIARQDWLKVSEAYLQTFVLRVAQAPERISTHNGISRWMR